MIRAIVFDMGGGRTADGFFLPGVHQAFEAEISLLFLAPGFAGLGNGASMDPDQQLPLLEDPEVFPDGDFRDSEIPAELGDIDRGVFFQSLENSGPASLGRIVNVHADGFV